MNDSFVSKSDDSATANTTVKFIGEIFFHINPQPTWKALEVGTQISLAWLENDVFFSKLILNETSLSLQKELKHKLNRNNTVEVLQGQIYDYQQRDIDLVFSNMVFHHLHDLEDTIHHLATITKPGAWVAISDLVTEDGSFHNFEPIPHYGFNTHALAKTFVNEGFIIRLLKKYNVISRTFNSETKNYDQFILIAQRR